MGTAIRRANGFTLIEVLLVVAIVAMLLSILLPTISGAMERARAFRCQVAQRSVTLDFVSFADPLLHGDRGDDGSMAPRFRLETFQDAEYRIDEFWSWGEVNEHTVPDGAGNDPMRCASVDGALTLSKGKPCTKGALSPPENVSYTFNSRLHRTEVTLPGGPIISKPVRLTDRVLDMGMVPLMWDVDGGAAKEKGAEPVFSAPALDSQALYVGDKLWFPSARHGGAANFAFLDGHVESSRAPLEESGWLWGYSPAE